MYKLLNRGNPEAATHPFWPNRLENLVFQSATRWTRCTSRGSRNPSTSRKTCRCRSSVCKDLRSATAHRTTQLVTMEIHTATHTQTVTHTNTGKYIILYIDTVFVVSSLPLFLPLLDWTIFLYASLFLAMSLHVSFCLSTSHCLCFHVSLFRCKLEYPCLYICLSMYTCVLLSSLWCLNLCLSPPLSVISSLHVFPSVSCFSLSLWLP